MTPMIDIAFEEYDHLVRLKPLTAKARHWFQAHVSVEDPSLTVNGWIPTDKVPASRLLEDASDDKLYVAPVSPAFFQYAWNTSLPEPIFLTLPLGSS